jgi:hypothetical protein
MSVKKLVENFAKENGLDLASGGGFKESKNWDGEFGQESLGIVIHDGGDMAPYINLDYECYSLEEKFTRFLSKHGLYHEPCTCWYTAIYKI